MMSIIKHIFLGWNNILKDKMGILSPKIKIEAERRLDICVKCINRRGENCGLCGCYLPAKATTNSPCPIGKWDLNNKTKI
jgi:hypothetical protein